MQTKQINKLEVLKNVIKCDSNADGWVDVYKMAQALELYSFHGGPDDAQTRLRVYAVTEWLCTDTHVGLSAIYFDGKLVGCIEQWSRKGDVNYSWVSAEAAMAVRNFLAEGMEFQFPTIGADDTVDSRYRVNYRDQIPCVNGWYAGKPVTYVKEPRARVDGKYLAFDADYDCVILIAHEDGTTERIPVSEFYMDLHVPKHVVDDLLTDAE